MSQSSKPYFRAQNAGRGGPSGFFQHDTRTAVPVYDLPRSQQADVDRGARGTPQKGLSAGRQGQGVQATSQHGGNYGYSGDYGQQQQGRGSTNNGWTRNFTKLELKLKRLNRQLRSANAALESDYNQLRNELMHYQNRVKRVEEEKKLELARLKKEVEYHKRLRQGAELRSFELEERSRQQASTSESSDKPSAKEDERDEMENQMAVQSQILLSKNAELTHNLRMAEAQASQLLELKACLEAELEEVYNDRERLETELEELLHANHQREQLSPLYLVGEEDEEDMLSGDGLGDDYEDDGLDTPADASDSPEEPRSSSSPQNASSPQQGQLPQQHEQP